MPALFEAMSVEVIWLGMWVRFPPGTISTDVHADVYARAHEVNGKQYTAVFPDKLGIGIQAVMDGYAITFGRLEDIVENQHDTPSGQLAEAPWKTSAMGWEDRPCYRFKGWNRSTGSLEDFDIMIFPIDVKIEDGKHDAHAKQHMIDMIVKGERP